MLVRAFIALVSYLPVKFARPPLPASVLTPSHSIVGNIQLLDFKERAKQTSAAFKTCCSALGEHFSRAYPCRGSQRYSSYMSDWVGEQG